MSINDMIVMMNFYCSEKHDKNGNMQNSTYSYYHKCKTRNACETAVIFVSMYGYRRARGELRDKPIVSLVLKPRLIIMIAQHTKRNLFSSRRKYRGWTARRKACTCE